MSKRRIASLLLVSALMLGGTASTYAWFWSTDEVTNNMSTGSIKHRINTTAGNLEGMLPGDSRRYEVSFTNTGNNDALLRVKFQLTESTNDAIMPVLSDTLDDNWVLSSDGYYYYKKLFNIGATTTNLIDSVVFNGLNVDQNDKQETSLSIDVDSETVQCNVKEAFLYNWSSADEGVLSMLESLVNSENEMVIENN